VNRVRGQAHVCDLACDEPRAVYIDAMFLSNPHHSIPILKANFGLYEKFFVHGLKLDFIPTQPVTVGGSVAIAPDYDPLDPMPATRAALSSSQGYKTGPVTSRVTCEMPNYKGPSGDYIRPDLYCAPTNDDRLTCFGQFKCFASAPTLSKGDVVGRLVLHYDISFHILEPSSEVTYTTTSIERLVSVGNATAFKPTQLKSITMSDGLKTQNSVGGDITLAADRIMSAIVDTVNASMPMETSAGKTVNPGTRIYVRPVIGNIATTTYTNVSDSEYVGDISLSRNFDPMSNIKLDLVDTLYSTIMEAQIL